MCSPSAPPPPDYGPMSAASDYAADLGYKLGSEQLAEGRRQYDQNMAVARPVADAQLGIMADARRQADDYYEYGKSGRPVEAELNRQSMIDTTARDEAERGLITGGNTDIYNARRGDIEDSVGRATADARQGLTGEYNRMLRQGLRYGYSPAAMAQRFGSNATQAGLGVAAAANAARTAGIDQARGLLNQNRNLRVQDDAVGWGKKLDVAGLYRNMPGASQGAYGLATNAGSAAVANQMAPGGQLLNNMAAGAGMQQTGAGQKITGLGSVLNAQSAYNSMLAQMESSGGGGLGALLGAGATLGSAYMKYGMGAGAAAGSDRRFKENIVLVGRDDATELNLYEFNYKSIPNQRFVGVMADEVEPKYPQAVVRDADGMAYVKYSMLGLEMREV